jgi:hypothetical protein
VDKLIALLLALATAQARGESNAGAAYYGIQHKDWPCAESLRALRAPGEQRMAILWDTFGTREGCLRRWLDQPGKKLLQIHLINECCVRSRDCQWYEFPHGHSVKSYEAAVREFSPAFARHLEQHIAPAAALVAAYAGPDFRCLISPGLETNLSAEAMGKLTRRLKPLFPGCRFVSHGRRIKDAKFTEQHVRRAQSAPCILSNDDGKDAPSDMGKWLETGRNCRAVMVWHKRFNGWAPGQTTGDTDPRGRTNWPKQTDFDWLRRNLK